MVNPLMSTIKLARFKFVSKMLSQKDTVLDLGCGNGLSSYYYSKFCKSVHGVDIQDAVSDSWKTLKTPNITFSQADILTPQAYKYNASTITCVDVIEHFDKEQGDQILQYCCDCLKNQGRGTQLIIGTPSRHSQQYRAAHNQEHHLYEYDPDELQAICDKYFSRTFKFSMNDEVVHTGFSKLAWFFYVICVL